MGGLVLFAIAAVAVGLQWADLFAGKRPKGSGPDTTPLQSFQHLTPSGDPDERMRLGNAIVGTWTQRRQIINPTITFSAGGNFNSRGVYTSGAMSGTWAVIDPNTVEVIESDPQQKSASRHMLKVSVQGDALEFTDPSPNVGMPGGPPGGEYFRQK